MTVKDCVKIGMNRQNLTQTALAEKIGVKHQSVVAETLSRNDGMGMRVETLIRWLDALDAQLVVEFIDGDMDDEIVLDGE